MDEIGLVKRIDGVNATVVVEKRQTCEGCKENESCGITSSDNETQTIEITALNIAGAKVGQMVKVTAKSFTYVKGAMLVYGLPAVALLLGAVFGKYLLHGAFPAVNPETLSAASGFSAFIISYIALKILSGNIEKKTENTPIVEQIIER
ncbi:MAG: SoxR reducing system RseC family protein [Candidatus Magnetominusculus sp. LBB02]|nr:SoxR reducing system RseC family protein [Candidatus Magnetominusculus sp. LBB02]